MFIFMVTLSLLFRLKASAVLAVCYCVLGILGLISVGALLVLCSKSCERPTCNFAKLISEFFDPLKLNF